MKAIVLTTVLFLTCSAAFAQQSIGEALAQKIATRMKDSLQLTNQQQMQLYTVNMQLHNLKMQARQQYTGTDSLGFKMQKVEYMRDSMYQAILPPDKYILYKDKKAVLVNNN